jgi:hypothetical protein
MTLADLQTIENMHQRGGNFARALAHAAAAADPENLAKIKATWPELWERYANWKTREADGQL